MKFSVLRRVIRKLKKISIGKKKNRQLCQICYSNKRQMKLECCAFSICRPCLTKHYEIQIQNGVIQIPCPSCMICHKKADVIRIVSDEFGSRFQRYIDVSKSRDRNSLEKTCPKCSAVRSIIG